MMDGQKSSLGEGLVVRRLEGGWTFEPIHGNRISMTDKEAFAFVGLVLRESPVVTPGTMIVPIRPDDSMITSAAEAHYGVRRVRACGGIMGIDLAVNGQDWTFRSAFRRMWRGALGAIPAQRIVSPGITPDPRLSQRDGGQP